MDERDRWEGLQEKEKAREEGVKKGDMVVSLGHLIVTESGEQQLVKVNIDNNGVPVDMSTI